MTNLLSYQYWLGLNPGPLMPILQTGLAVLTAAFLLAVIALNFSKKKYRKNLYYRVMERFSLFSLTNFIIGLFLLFFTYESVPFFSSRFWFFLWVIGDIVWLYFIIKLILSLPEKKIQFEKEREFRKYVP